MQAEFVTKVDEENVPAVPIFHFLPDGTCWNIILTNSLRKKLANQPRTFEDSLDCNELQTGIISCKHTYSTGALRRRRSSSTWCATSSSTSSPASPAPRSPSPSACSYPHSRSDHHRLTRLLADQVMLPSVPSRITTGCPTVTAPTLIGNIFHKC